MILCAVMMAAVLADSPPVQVEPANAQLRADQSALPKRIQKILAKGDGATPETAYRVRSVADEYAILRALGLEARQQSLIIRKKAYDLLTVWDPQNKVEKQIWFDINQLYPIF